MDGMAFVKKHRREFWKKENSTKISLVLLAYVYGVLCSALNSAIILDSFKHMTLS